MLKNKKLLSINKNKFRYDIKISMKKEAKMDRFIKKVKRMRSRIIFMYITGKLDSSLELIKQAEELIRDFQGDLPIELEELHCYALKFKESINAYREDLEFNFKLANEFLTIAEKYDNKWGVSEAMYALGRNYWLGGDLDKSLMHFDRGLMLKDQINAHDNTFYADMIRIATKIAVEKGDLERARKYFNRIKEYFEQNPEVGGTLIIAYKLSKAYILGSSMRSRDRIQAEDLLKEIIEYGFSIDIYKIEAILKLSELLLIELRLTNDMDVINEINPLISKFIEMTLKRKYNYFLIEAYVLQGKLSLLTFEIKTARRFLTQAQRIAEQYRYKGVADEISSLHEDLIQKIDTWKHLKKNNAPLTERIELSRLNDHLEGQFRKKIMRMERIAEEEVTVYKDLHSCLVCKGSAGGFNIYVCPKCNSIYCKKCTQAVIELENTCWSCNSPIDETRPLKPLELEKEDEVEIKKMPKDS